MKAFIFLVYLFFAMTLFVSAQDSCVVSENVRPDGLMMRSLTFEEIYAGDSIRVSAAMYAIDKDYYLVVKLQTPTDIKNYHKDISLKMSDSTVVLLKFNTFNSDKQNQSYEAHFSILKQDLGYIEKYKLLQINYTINKQNKYIRIQVNKDVLIRHYACLRNK